MPLLSEIGSQISTHFKDIFLSELSSSLVPTISFEASPTIFTVGATAPRTTFAFSQIPSLDISTATDAETTAISISVLGVNLKYASLENSGLYGMSTDTINSPFCNDVLPGAIGMSSTLHDLSP